MESVYCRGQSFLNAASHDTTVESLIFINIKDDEVDIRKKLIFFDLQP